MRKITIDNKIFYYQIISKLDGSVLNLIVKDANKKNTKIREIILSKTDCDADECFNCDIGESHISHIEITPSRVKKFIERTFLGKSNV